VFLGVCMGVCVCLCVCLWVCLWLCVGVCGCECVDEIGREFCQNDMTDINAGPKLGLLTCVASSEM
jgi:hypothetical protein